MTTRWHRVVAAVVAMLVIGGAGALWAQARVEEAGGSLAAVTAELRQLRLAVEESTRAQTQTQALSVSLSAQQSRMVQLSTRLDATRTELTTTVGRLREATRLVEAAKADMAQMTNPEERRQADAMIAMFSEQAAITAAQERQLRAREAELAQAMHVEETRWADLIARLEQMIRK